MKNPELFQAIQNTPLYDTWRDPVNEITDPHDRQRLMLLVTQDGDVMADLLADATAVLTEMGGFQDRLTNAVAAHFDQEATTFCELSSGIGAYLVTILIAQIDKHINDNAADWLAILRHDQRLCGPARTVHL